MRVEIATLDESGIKKLVYCNSDGLILLGEPTQKMLVLLREMLGRRLLPESFPVFHDSETKLLIANRGEIAVRILRAAKDSGYSTVGIYADADRNAQHAKLADEAYALVGETAVETYLSIEKIIAIAKRWRGV
mgnify:CR=1 FL=1